MGWVVFFIHPTLARLRPDLSLYPVTVRKTAITAILVFWGVAACAPETTTTTTALPTTSTTSSTTIPVSGGPIPCCLTGDQLFVGSGSLGILSAGRSDSETITRFSWETHDECERLTIQFNSGGGAPALDPPSGSAMILGDSGVIRITLDRAITESAVSEHLVSSRFVNKIYVVRSNDETLFVDIHLAEPALARITSSSSPAMIRLDLRPDGTKYSTPPIVSDDLVIVHPTTGNISYPFSVLGYTRKSGKIEATITGETGEVAKASSPVTERGDTWRAFVLLFPLGPTGAINVEIEDTVQFELTSSP